MITKFSERDGVSDNVDGDGHSTKKDKRIFILATHKYVTSFIYNFQCIRIHVKNYN